MYHIAILSDEGNQGQQFLNWTRSCFSEKGLFPRIELHLDEERFFQGLEAAPPCGVIVDLPGVAGLNAAEHLRSLCPDCGLIWCSDLDFSLHAYKLRSEYFLLAPAAESDLREGLSVWIERKATGKDTPSIIGEL